MKKKLLSIFMVITVIVLPLTGCTGAFTNKKSEESPYKDFIVVDVFDSLANFQGIQSGWFGEIVKKKFNMELNIIAPNIASGGDNLFEMRSASGNVGDLIISTTENGYLQDMIDEGLIIDMSKFLEGKQIMRYGTAITILNDKLKQKGIYAIPSEISLLSPDTSAKDRADLRAIPQVGSVCVHRVSADTDTGRFITGP
jgi:multiple sugar transport system substrate-binding protein/putative aldouronate transport system substrate-binding protein